MPSRTICSHSCNSGGFSLPYLKVPHQLGLNQGLIQPATIQPQGEFQLTGLFPQLTYLEWNRSLVSTCNVDFMICTKSSSPAPDPFEDSTSSAITCSSSGALLSRPENEVFSLPPCVQEDKRWVHPGKCSFPGCLIGRRKYVRLLPNPLCLFADVPFLAPPGTLSEESA